MESMYSKLIHLSLMFLAQPFFGAETATLDGWPSGEFDLQCPFTYEIDRELEWNKTEEPPLTLKELNEVFEAFSLTRYPDKDVFIGSYLLIYNNFLLGGNIGWTYLISYRITEPENRSVDGFNADIGRALVTMQGTVIEVECDAQ